MTHAWSSLAVFILCYALFVLFPNRRSWVAGGGALLLMAVGAAPWGEALLVFVQWNVMGLFVGMLVLADLFALSRMPAVMAEWLVDRTRTALGAMLVICVLSGFISAFVENVAVVLLVAPVALSLTRKLNINPVPVLIGIAISSNLQGTATLIGDPPSMLLAGFMKLSFNDFFVYQGKPGIFFAVQCGAAASLLVLAWFFRHHHSRIEALKVEHVRSWVPTILLLALLLGLSVSSFFDPEFKWLAGTMTMVCAVIGLLWNRFAARWKKTGELLKTLDWDTTFFLVGVFILVGALSESGWLNHLSKLLAGVAGTNLLVAFALLVGVAMVVSGFVDNVPFLMAMLPVAQQMAHQMNAPEPPLMFGLLIGACLGGNITPIGASANIVAMGLLKKEGHTVKFGQFVAMGLPFTLVAVLASSLFVWWVWVP